MVEEHVSKKEAEKKEYLANLMFKNHWQITFRVIILTALPLLVLGGGGYLLDKILGTTPILTIIGVLLAFIASQTLNYVVFRKLTEK